MIAPPPKNSDTRLADRLIDEYLATVPGTPKAIKLLAEAAKAHKTGEWEPNPAGILTVKPADRRGAGSLTKDERKRLAKLHIDGVHVDKIAASLGVRSHTVYRALASTEVKHRVTQSKLRRAPKLRRQGLTIQQIAHRIGVGVSSVCVYLKETKEGDNVSAKSKR